MFSVCKLPFLLRNPSLLKNGWLPRWRRQEALCSNKWRWWRQTADWVLKYVRNSNDYIKEGSNEYFRRSTLGGAPSPIVLGAIHRLSSPLPLLHLYLCLSSAINILSRYYYVLCILVIYLTSIVLVRWSQLLLSVKLILVWRLMQSR